jgi:hypothetical protein
MNFSRRTWFMLCIASLSCIPITLHFFPIAFPILSLNITMNRTQALERARELAEKHHLLPTVFDQAAIFHLDDSAKTFIELDGGGKDALVDTMTQDLYMPYVWVVRHFKEHDPRSTLIFFKPNGTPYGFEQQLSENDPGENVSSDYARVIAETQARDVWHIDLSAYTLIEAAHETHPSGRIDHTFVYERSNLTIGSGGTYRLRLGVSGDQFSTLTHGIHIPQTFTRRYEEMRSTNETIADVADLWYKLFYLLGGCVLGLLWLARARFLIVRTPIICALVIAFLITLTKLNQLPVIWIMYDTALPAQNFLFAYLIKALYSFVSAVIPLTLGFIVAESLSRKAFGSHPQLWRVWSSENAASSDIAGSTLGAYLLVLFDLAMVSVFYAYTITYRNWWVPSAQFFDPNILATYLPWLEPCIESVYAGAYEECVFRAIPIAGAALIGERMGKRNVMIALAFIMQALVFSAGHANYPGNPAYARLLELLLPSFIYGFMYLRWGLLPVIISHSLYDIVWSAIPIFASHAPYAWFNQLIITAFALIPAAIVLRAHISAGAWKVLSDAQRNFAWQPPVIASQLPAPDVFKPKPYVLNHLMRNALLFSGIIGFPLWLYTTNFHNDALPLYTSRDQALSTAQQYAHAHGMSLDGWYPIVTVQNIDDDNDAEHRFVWQHTDPKTYSSLLNTYLLQPRWLIRFLNFDGDLIERAEEYRVGVQDNHLIHGFYHVVPESTPGASLTREQARDHVETMIAEETGFDLSTLSEIEASPLKLPARTDWKFVIADSARYPLAQGQGRMQVQLAGDTLSRLSWNVHVPETWERADRTLRNKTKTIRILSSLLLYLLALCAAYAVAQTRRFPFSFPSWRAIFIFLLLLYLITLMASWSELIVMISTSEPFYHQVFGIFGPKIVYALIYAGILSILLMTVTNLHYRYSLSHTPYKDFCALGLGTLITGLISCIEWFQPSLKPHWAKYSALNSLAPATTMMINALLDLLIFGVVIGMLYALVDYLTNTGNRNHILGAISIFIFSLGITAQEPFFSISHWIFTGIAFGLILIAAYYLLLRLHRALLPLVILPFIVGTHVQQAVMNAFTESIAMNLLATTYCIIAAYLWSYAFMLGTEASQREIE